MSELKIFYYLFLLTLLDATSQIRPSLHGHNNGKSFSLRFLPSLFPARLLLHKLHVDPRPDNNNRLYHRRNRLQNFTSVLSSLTTTIEILRYFMTVAVCRRDIAVDEGHVAHSELPTREAPSRDPASH